MRSDGMLKTWMRLMLAGILMPAPGLAAETPAGRVDFARDVRPILEKHCHSCHGPQAQEGELRLDAREPALRGGASGPVVRAGDSAGSPLLARVRSLDPDLRMPQDGQPLSPAEVDLLARWIQQGADWPDEEAAPSVPWSLQPLRPVTPPPASVDDARSGVAPSHHPIDAFVAAELQRQGLRASPPADPRTLVRRLFLDLTGLPPTPADVAEFLEDPSDVAYERLVDRLLASPRYGERWARHWIDVVHWAETHGHDQDRPRPHAWPYRDYLIRSFNTDKPYARFVAEQVAGDALYPEDSDATVALGLLAGGPWDESTLMSIQDDTVDRKMGQVLDRDDMITTVMSTFCSATVHCARCHNHKFDPISQADYYALQAVFAGVDRTERPFDADPAVQLQRRTWTTRKRELQLRADSWFGEAEAQSLASQLEAEFLSSRTTWRVLAGASCQTEHGSAGAPQPDGSFLFTGERPDKETYTWVFTGDFAGITALQLEVLTDPSLPKQGPGRQDNGNLHLSEVQLTSSAMDGSDSQLLAFAQATADFNQENWEITKAIDGKPETAWGIHPEVGKPHVAVFALREPVRRAGPSRFTVVLQQLHGAGHLIGRPRLAVTTAARPETATPRPAELAAALDTPSAERSVEQRIIAAKFLLQWQVERALQQLPPPGLVYAVADRAASNGVPIMPPAEPRVVHLLRRGDIRQPQEMAAPGSLSCLNGLPARFALAHPERESERRAALANWLIDPQNVLVWRSIVNRVWHYHFGRGLVDTPNDLGRMGGTPSHPELLDWLARDFRDSGGSLKRLHRLILTSRTWRQSSRSDPDAVRRDGGNRYWWRMNATRLDAESIRDSLLQISGKLDLTMGGPSVKQFIESPGVQVTPNVDYDGLDIDAPAQHRRSIYRFLFRTLPDPFMASMDCPDASQWAPTRNVSVTALQALSMWNNRFVVRQSEHTAQRIAELSEEPAEQVRLLFQLALARDPDPTEAPLWQSHAARHGLTNTCRVMFNTNEFMFVR